MTSVIKKILTQAKTQVKTMAQRHKARRTVSGLHLVLADRVAMINSALWDVLAARTVFLSRTYLQVLEGASPDNLQMRYAMACDGDGQPVAIALLQRIEVTGQRLPQKHALEKRRAKVLSNYKERVLVCGNVLIWGPRSVACAEDVEPAQIWHALCEAIYRLRRADKLQGESDLILVKDLAAQEGAAFAEMRTLGYRQVETEPDMVLDIRASWKTYDDYLASMTSSYRSNAKKLRKDCDKIGVSFRLIDAAEHLQKAAELHALYLQVHEGQPLRLATLNPLYLAHMAQALGDGFRCRVAELEGKAVGFVTCVLDGEQAIGYYIGYDKTANESAPIYLTLLGSCVEDAIEMGATSLSLGRTALEPKAKMGCKPVALACAVKHRVSMLNPLLSVITQNASHAEPPERSPFKAEAQS